MALALCAALLTALFMVPWKLAAQYGATADAVLVLLLTAAVCNTAITLGPVLLRRQRLQWSPTMGWVAAGMALLTLAGNLASGGAIARIDGALLSLLQRAEVVLVALLAWVALGERIDRAFVLGTAIAGVGLGLLTGVDVGATAEADRALGIALGLGSAAAFGGMIVLVRRFAQRIHAVTVNALRLWLAVGLWGVTEQRLPAVWDFDPRLLGYAALAAVSGPVLARLSLMLALKHIEARLVTLLLLSTPVLTLLTTGLLLGQWPTAGALLGGAVMLLGIAIPVLVRARASRVRNAPAP